MAGQPWSLASTDLQHGIPLYRLSKSVTAKQTRERLQGGADQPLPGPTGQSPLHSASLSQVHPRGDSYFGGILNFLVIS
jgi:hypothetical protein